MSRNCKGRAANKVPFVLLSDPSIECSATCLPCIVMSQNDYVSPVDITHIPSPPDWPGYREIYFGTSYNETWNYWTNWSVSLPDEKWLGYIHPGDCGHPIWALMDGELVAAGTWYSPTGPCWGFHIEDINNAITDLANAFDPPLPTCAVTPADHSGFPDL